MAVNLHIIGRVRENHPRQIPLHQSRDHAGVERIATGQAVRPQLPKIAKIDAARCDVGQNVVVRIARLLGGQAFDQTVDLRHLKTDHPDIKPDILGGEQALQLLSEKLFIPTGIQRQLVVSNHISPLLGLGHVFNADAGDSFQPEGLGGLDPPMTCKDGVRLVDQHRVGKAEGPDRLGNLLQLLFGMGPGVACHGRRSPGARCSI